MAIINLPDIYGFTYEIDSGNIESMRECTVLSNSIEKLRIATEVTIKGSDRRIVVDKTMEEIFQIIVDTPMKEFKTTKY